MLTYKDTGVNYETMDPFKRLAQRAASETGDMLKRFGFSEVTESRGESVYLIEMEDRYIAHVEEGLGTKILVADAIYEQTGVSYYHKVAQCAVAMIVNDMVTLGALPISVAMHLAVGSSDWFNDEAVSSSLVEGWKHSCLMAGCSWAGGETPTLKGIVIPGTAVLDGSAVGVIKPKEKRIISNIRAGDVIVLVGSSGIHANGLTLARSIAERKPSLWRRFLGEFVKSGALPYGYLTPTGSGRSYGEELLEPTKIYVRFVEECLKESVEIHYIVNITGHGWRKLMRAKGPFRYVIDWVPEPQPVFDFIQQHGPVSDREMYGTFNMGAGFALYVPKNEAARVISVAGKYGHIAWLAGHIERAKEEKEVVIQPKGIIYKASELGVR